LPFHFSTDRNLPFVEYGGEKNSSVLAAGAGCSSSGFQNLGDRACKALSLGEVAAAVRLRKAGFGEGTPQQDSDGTE
jgi:hypothetical protein